MRDAMYLQKTINYVSSARLIPHHIHDEQNDGNTAADAQDLVARRVGHDRRNAFSATTRRDSSPIQRGEGRCGEQRRKDTGGSQRRYCSQRRCHAPNHEEGVIQVCVVWMERLVADLATADEERYSGDE